MTDGSDGRRLDQEPEVHLDYSDSLDVLVSLSRTLCDIPADGLCADRILSLAGSSMRRLIPLTEVAFVMCDDDGLGFHVEHCFPASRMDSIRSEVDLQIDQQVFAWVLRQNRSVVVPALEGEATLMMQVLASETRVFGVFVGRLDGRDCEISAASQRLAWVLMLHCASVLESRRLQSQLNESNRDLEETVEERTRALRESEREAQQANRAKSEFIANMSHELRTPMNGVLGMARVLGETELTGEQSEIVGTILQSSSGLLSIMDDVLEYARLDSAETPITLSTENLKEVTRGALELISAQAKQIGVELRFHYGEEVPQEFLLDARRIRQVLLTLLGNAIKFTSEGYIELRVERVSGDDQTARIRISVEDSGIGISDSGLERIFEHFSQVDSSMTREFGGVGLGLAIAQRLVTLMDGAMGATSLLGEGSNFFVCLDLEIDSSPRRPDPAASKKAHSSGPYDPPARRRSIHVLVVEDNPVNQKVLRMMLKRMGCEVELANNGLEGVQRVDEREFDIVFMDCQMPEMDGYSATAWIRRMEQGRGHIPIVAVTANAVRGDREKCLDAGMDDYLSKPVDPTDLRRALDFWTSSRARRGR